MTEQPERKTALVDKPIAVTYDFGNLAVFDTNPIDASLLETEQKETHLRAAARDNIQLLINQLLSLPTKRTTQSAAQTSSTQDSTMVLFQLPDPTTPLPREKPIPRPKAPTKWELFAKKKGIQKKAKDGKLVYDEQSKEWVPKWGYKGTNKKLDDQWLVEVDEDKHRSKEGDLLDPRKMARDQRKKVIRNNERQQKKNLQRK